MAVSNVEHIHTMKKEGGRPPYISTYVAVTRLLGVLQGRGGAEGDFCRQAWWFSHIPGSRRVAGGHFPSQKPIENAHWQVAVCPCAFKLPCQGSSCLIWPLPCVFKNVEHARTIRSKSYQASGRRAKTANVQNPHACQQT